MSCYEYLSLMSGHIDQMNTVQEEQALQAHLASCPKCRRVLAQMEQNDKLLNRSAVQPPADLTDRIMKKVRRRTKKSRVNKPAIVSAIVSGLTVAAVMTLVFFGKTILLPANSSDESHNEYLTAAFDTEAAYADQADLEETDAAYDAPSESIAEIIIDQELSVSGTGESVTQTTAAPEEDTAIYGLPPVYAEEEITEDAEPNNSPPKRGIHSAETLSISSPVLIIWNADSEMISLLSEYEPEENDGTLFADIASEFPAALISRLSSVLPLSDSDEDIMAEAAHWNVDVYHVPYDVMNSLFYDCVGQYEVNAYYPPDVLNPDDCVIFVVRQTDGIPELPQEEN